MKDQRLMVFAEFATIDSKTQVHQVTELVRPELFPEEERRLKAAGAKKVWSLRRANVTPEAWARAAHLTKQRAEREQLELFAAPRRHHP